MALEGARLAIQHRDVKEMHKSMAPLLRHGPCAPQARQWPKQRQDEVAGYRAAHLFEV